MFQVSVFLGMYRGIHQSEPRCEDVRVARLRKMQKWTAITAITAVTQETLNRDSVQRTSLGEVTTIVEDDDGFVKSHPPPKALGGSGPQSFFAKAEDFGQGFSGITP
jgi:hypothetical protein